MRSGGIQPARWAQRDKDPGEHEPEAKDAHKDLLDDHSGHEHRDAREYEQHPNRNDRVVRLALARRYGSDEVGIILVEIALHLFEESLLLFRKWHLVPLSYGIVPVIGIQFYAPQPSLG